MLELFRRNRKSILGTVIVGFSALLMLGFGVDLFAGSSNSGAAVTIDDIEVSQTEYYRYYNNFINRARSRYGESFEQAKQVLNFPQQAVDSLVTQRLMNRFTDKLELTASVDQQVLERIRKFPFFANRGFNRETYQTFLRTIGMSGKALETEIGREIVREQLSNLLTQTYIINENELRANFIREKTKYNFRFVKFNAADYLDKIDTNDDEALLAHYEENQEQFRKPQSASYTFVKFSPSDFISSVEITEEDVEIEYEQRSRGPRYREPKKIRLRQIVMKKAEPKKSELEAVLEDSADESADGVSKEEPNKLILAKAEEAIARLETGEEFEALVAELSEDEATKQEAGDLGWSTMKTLDPEIAKAVRDLDIGEISEVIERDDSFTIVKVEEAKDARVKTLEEVRPLIENEIRSAYSSEYAQAEADAFLSDWKASGSSLKDFAATTKQTAEETEAPLEKGTEAPNGIAGLTEKVLQFGTGARDSSVINDVPFVFEVGEVKPSYIPEFKDVRAAVVESYKKVAAAAKAAAEAESFQTELQTVYQEKAANPEAEVVEVAANTEGGDSPEEKTEAAADTPEAEVAQAATAPTENKVLEQLASKKGYDSKTLSGVTPATAVGEMFISPEARKDAFLLTMDKPLAPRSYNAGDVNLVFELIKQEAPDLSEFSEKKKELVTQEQAAAGGRLFAALIGNLKANAQIDYDDSILTIQ